jgi:RecA-family ATPase
MADKASTYEAQNHTDETKTGWREHAVSAAALLGMDFPPLSYTVPGIVPEGLCLLAGKPKIGKSWLALEICLGVALKEPVLGELEPVHGDVLYCALEDTKSRLQRRIHKLLWPPRMKWPSSLTLVTRWRRLDAGGVEDIADWAASVKNPRLVVLDTLAGVRPERSARDTTYDGDYKALIELHRLSNESHFSAMALHHTRKMEADDPFDTISGTLGQIGCADTGLILARGTQGTSLYVRGRDVEESEHAITFNADTCRWKVLGDAVEVRRSETRKKVLAALARSQPMGPKEIALASMLPENSVSQRLIGMVEKGEVVKTARGKYALPGYCDDP